MQSMGGVVMATWIIILGFAISSSIDSLRVGICYGIRRIRVSFLANLLIAVICFLFSAAGILCGNWLALILPGVLPILVGTFLLFVLGLRLMLLAIPPNPRLAARVAKQHLTCCNIKTILTHPEIADADRSGELDLDEAIVLGIALSANTLTIGLGAGLLGFSPHAIAITTAIASFILVWAGVFRDRRIAPVRIGSFSLAGFSTILSGVILLGIAIYTLL